MSYPGGTLWRMNQRNNLPFSAAVAPVRARHHADVVAVAAWCLEHGRPCDRDAVALCFDVLEQHRSGDGFELDRPTVADLLHVEVWNAATMLGSVIPKTVPQAMWSVITCLDDAGRLKGRVPIDVLREPLRCYGGLGEDGLPMPPEMDVDFGCQCLVPYDPTLPAGVGKHVVGRHPESYEPLYAKGLLHPRRDPPSAEDQVPLLLYATRVLREWTLDLSPSDFAYAGRVTATRGGPELWLYHTTRTERRGAQALTLDVTGGPWRPRVDRRFRPGFRWERASEMAAAIWAGIEGRKTDDFDDE